MLSPDLVPMLDHVAPAMLVVVRIGGLFIFSPIFGSPAVPVRVKILLAFVLGGAAYPVLAHDHAVGAGLTLDLFSLPVLLGTELLIGLLVGHVASLPLVAVQTSGLIMGQQMGLGFARFYNPGIDDEADVLGQLLFFLALAGFLALGGHDALMLAILHSFEHVPLGGFTADGSVMDLITGLLLAAFEVALRIAAPVLALIFLQSIAMGFMAKTVPQLNILSLGFPIRILVGISTVMIGLVILDQVMLDFIEGSIETLFAWIAARGEG